MPNTEMNKAWQLVTKTGTSIFLTGKAGTGKTTFLKKLKQLSPKRMVVLAPTGVSAINAEGVTIHSFFQLPLAPYIPGNNAGANYDKRLFIFSKHKRELINSIDLLVIDEISMVRADVLDAVDAVLRRLRRNSNPFGGVQLLMIGDVRQLAPVITDREREILSAYYETPFFFSSKALQSTSYITVELKKVYRQQDDDFLGLLNNIRDNKADESTLAALNKRYIPDFTSPAGKSYIMLTALNRTAKHYNEQQLAGINEKPFTFRADISGDFPETSLPTDMFLTLKQGAQVIFIKNDTSGRNYYNGMIGTIVSLGENTVKVRNDDSGSEFFVEKEEWKNIRYTLNPDTREITEEVEGTFRQYPLKLAWAITIHKSQGLTFEHAIIDTSSSFAPGQAYVALSRCKTLEGMVLRSPIKASDILSDKNVEQFIETADSCDTSPERINELEREYTIRMIDEMFDLSSVLQALRLFTRQLEGNTASLNAEFYSACLKEETVIAGLTDIAKKFRNEYTARAEQSHDLTSSPFTERIRKAAAYFGSQIKPLLSLTTGASPETTNKATAKRINENLSTLRKAVFTKSEVFRHEADSDTIFSAYDYMNAKARAAQTYDNAAAPFSATRALKTKTKKEKTPKQPRIRTATVSYELYKQGKCIPEIAAERNLSIGTIQAHLSEYVRDNLISAEKLMPPARINHINKLIDSSDKTSVTLNEIKKLSGQDFSFGEIKIVFASRGINSK